MKELSENGLLGPGEVAGLVGVKESTVWRWCREGTLPALKVGKHWRVRRGALEDFLRRSERPVTLAGQLSAFLRVPDNVLAIAQNRDVLHRLDAAFFSVGEAHDGLLVKFYGGEDRTEDELVSRFEQNGLEAGRLRDEGRLLMREEEVSTGERGDRLGRLVEEESGNGRTVWASFDWVLDVELNTALEQQENLAELVDAEQLVVKTAALKEAIEEWSSSALVRAQTSHSGTILALEKGLWLARGGPMPAS
ncbi:helix-turn-helix domain-containing protein [Rubrobacter marinus]|uniref:Helix-turn-helix domain-containing protein n=1 Tax=Rubrobacter marinus TaxID=2653852 RepID=A0A6G8PSI9_9ACTN|nr:helix-turn-helix domain-containing protein [Rubrobacter marinus]QIN77449.1 helix-turn-helix domain-containing protein [Rubrobacter marinus]